MCFNSEDDVRKGLAKNKSDDFNLEDEERWDWPSTRYEDWIETLIESNTNSKKKYCSQLDVSNSAIVNNVQDC